LEPKALILVRKLQYSLGNLSSFVVGGKKELRSKPVVQCAVGEPAVLPHPRGKEGNNMVFRVNYEVTLFFPEGL
jgi:hypothetical protein